MKYLLLILFLGLSNGFPNELKKPDCNILQDEECFDKMYDYAFETVSQGYQFPNGSSDGVINLKPYGKKGKLKSGVNKEECATIIWAVGKREKILYSAKPQILESV